jgi:exodeoxyribonuclease-3
MRIVVWNCAMALHAKWDRLMSLRPDVAIVPECAGPAVLWKRRGVAEPCSFEWDGHNQNKGLGVFAFGEYTLARDARFDGGHQIFLPVHVHGPVSFKLLGVWAFNHRATTDKARLPAPTLAAIEHYADFLEEDALVAGDFNHSTVWDRATGHASNFGHIAARLGTLGLESAYHRAHSIEFGSEPHRTHFFRKGPLEYHIDYCFAPRTWGLSSVTVGARDDWIAASDHAPLCIEVSDTAQGLPPSAGVRGA